MQKLSKKTRLDIAGRVNSIVVARMMVADALEAKDLPGVKIWRNAEARAEVALSDLYGIDLPGLDISRARLRDIEAQEETARAARQAEREALAEDRARYAPAVLG